MVLNLQDNIFSTEVYFIRNIIFICLKDVHNNNDNKIKIREKDLLRERFRKRAAFTTF